MTTQFDMYQKMLKQQRLQTGLMVGQTALMGHMAGSLSNLQGEMNAIRQLNLQGLAVQQEMLQREQLQSQLEEFIYNTQKMIVEFGNDASEQPPSVRYFSLKGITETVQELGIGTALIRGRDNKAAFEAALKDVDRIVVSLEQDPDVVEAIAWATAEEKRVADEQRKQQAEQKRLLAEKEERRNELIHQISVFRNQRQKVVFSEWHRSKFGTLPLPAVIAMWALYGFLWIPLFFLGEKIKAESAMNLALDKQISMLEQELSTI